MSEQHKFRYLLPPGNNFAFVSKFRAWVIASVFLMSASIATLFINKAVRGEYMNWTIDFKGGTEIFYAFKNKSDGKFVKADPGKVRQAIHDGGEEADVSDTAWDDEKGQRFEGMIVRTARFSAIKPEAANKAREDLTKTFADRTITKANWSGDRLFVNSKKPITPKEAEPVFTAAGLELKQWDEAEATRYGTPDDGTGEYSAQFAIWGIDRQYEVLLESKLEGIDVVPAQSYGVGAKAGDKLRDDAVKSIIYSIFLIMLYLAFRFDVRYAPGAAFATVHDAIMVIGVFAVTWTDVSLTSVAGLLTVMGYSTNDTVIVFDRIRENQAKLKDKKLERIVDISINEMLVRTILTSSTVFATTLIMNIFGAGVVKEFAFAMNVGVLVGTYSSIFLAAPIFMWITRRFYSGPAPARRRVSPMQQPSETAAAPDAEE